MLSYLCKIINKTWNTHTIILGVFFTDQECYEYVKNVKASQTTQLTTESIDKESTTQGMLYLASSLTPNEESVRLYQDTDTPKTSTHM